MMNTDRRNKSNNISIKLQLEVPPFSANEAEQEKRRQRAEADPLFFCRTYLPHYFSKMPAPFHYELVELLDRRHEQGAKGRGQGSGGGRGARGRATGIVAAVPREFGKTTVCSFGYVLHQICCAKRKFIIIGTDTPAQGVELTENIYLELLYNERLRQDFGELVVDRQAMEDFVTTNDIRVTVRGRHQRLVGLKHKQWQPDLVILDDLESEENKDPQTAPGIVEWIMSDVLPAMDGRGSLGVIGTRSSRRSALNRILTSADMAFAHFERRIYRAIQQDGTSLWEAKYPRQFLQRQKQLMGVAAFNRDKMNEPLPEQGRFRPQWVRYYHPDSTKDKDLIVTEGRRLPRKGQGGPECEVMVRVGLNPREQVYYVLGATLQTPGEETSWQLRGKGHRLHGWGQPGKRDYAVIGMSLKEPERPEKDREQSPLIRGANAAAVPEAGIAALSSQMERGKIRFIRGHSDQNLVVEQLLYYPSEAMDDHGVAALEEAIRLAQQYVRDRVEGTPPVKRAVGDEF